MSNVNNVAPLVRETTVTVGKLTAVMSCTQITLSEMEGVFNMYTYYICIHVQKTHTHTNEIVSKLLTSSDYHHNYMSQTNFYTTHLKLYWIRHYLKNFSKTTNVFNLLGCKSVSIIK